MSRLADELRLLRIERAQLLGELQLADDITQSGLRRAIGAVLLADAHPHPALVAAKVHLSRTKRAQLDKHWEGGAANPDHN